MDDSAEAYKDGCLLASRVEQLSTCVLLNRLTSHTAVSFKDPVSTRTTSMYNPLRNTLTIEGGKLLNELVVPVIQFV